MNNGLQAKIRQQVADCDVTHVQLWFTDHIGELEMVEIPSSRFEGLLTSGSLPSDSQTEGFGIGAGADIVAVPDWSTFEVARGSRNHERRARVFCSLTSQGFVAFG